MQKNLHVIRFYTPMTSARGAAVVGRLLVAAGLAACGVGAADPAVDPRAAPPVTLPRTEVQFVPSRHVEGVTYELYVSLPRDYATGSTRYPVVYLLDADYSFAIARNVVEHLADRDRLPWMILVGIAYDGPPRYRLHRTRDYTPTHVPVGGYGPEWQRHSGGGPAFRRFLAEELVPFVERTYRTTGERALVGHSYGGLFATWTAFTEPGLFDRYLIVSPSLWYDDRKVFEVEEAWAASRDSLPARMYFAVGSREGNRRLDMVGDLRELGRRMERRRYRGLDLRVEVLDGETHDSVFPRALSNGLRAIAGGT